MNDSGAIFSEDRIYRYVLWRQWGSSYRNWNGSVLKMVAFVGLNPSTADETINDPTIRRCIGFAKDWGYDGMYMLNIFAFRSTDPKGLLTIDNPIGMENDYYISKITKKSSLVVGAWGNHGVLSDRYLDIPKLIDKPIYCLGHTKIKKPQPKHPLYLRADTKLEYYESLIK